MINEPIDEENGGKIIKLYKKTKNNELEIHFTLPYIDKRSDSKSFRYILDMF